MIKMMAAVRTFVIAGALLFGVPVLLALAAGSPLPQRVPSADQLRAWLDEPLQPRYAGDTARVVAWLIWAAVAAAVLAAAAAQIRRWPWTRLLTYVPRPLQGLAAAIIAAATVTAAGSAVAAPAAAATVPDGLAPTSLVGFDQTGSGSPRVDQPATAPHQAAHAASVRTRHATVTVRRGDTLSGIARHQLGDPNRWPAIFALNRHKHFPDVGGTLNNPDLIYPGWRLDLPPQSAPPEHAPPAKPTDPVHPDNPPRQQPASPQASAPAARPAPPSATTPAGDGVTRPTTTAPEPVADAPTMSLPSRPAPADAAHRDGVRVPGGWVTLPLAASLTAAGALLWLRRRHRYVPGQPGDTDTDDPGLSPLPAAIATMARAVRRRAPALLQPAPPQPSVAGYRRIPETERPDLPAPGPSGPATAGLAEPATTNGVGLLGPGAEPAARAILVATLSSGTPADPDAQSLAIITADALTTLLGADTAQLTHTPRLQVTADLPAALSRIEALLIERRRLLQDYDVTDLPALRAADPYHPPMPPVLLLAHTPPTNRQARLQNTLLQSQPVQITAILLGEWPPGHTTTVQADGHTSRDRLAVLDAPTTRQLLAMLHEAHTGEPDPTPPVATAAATVDSSAAPAAISTTGNTDGQSGTVAAAADATAAENADIAAAATPAPPAQHHRPQPVRIQLLGNPTIYGPDGNPVTGLRQHARELLVYLAVHRSGANLPDIMEAFWPHATLRRAAQRLSTEAADLRRRIRQAAGDDSIQPVVNTGGHYHLAADVVDIDLWRISDALHSAKTADPQRRATLLQQAVDAHTGSLAHGYDYDWIEQPRETLRRYGIRSRLYLAALIAHDDPAAAASLLHAAAALDPINEDVARQAIRAMAAAGDHTGAQTVLRRLRDALHDIDEEPSDETLTLAAHLHPSR